MKGRRSNPLALAVLVLLFERPMHPYEMAVTLKERHKEESIKMRYGSLYTVIEILVRDGFIRPLETIREGRRPERTVYELTSSGHTEYRDWMQALLRTPVKEYPQFEAGLSLLPSLPMEEALELLEARLVALTEDIEASRAGLREVAGMGLPALFTIESEYHLKLTLAERDFVKELIERIRQDGCGWADMWRKAHHGRRVPDNAKVAPKKKAKVRRES